MVLLVSFLLIFAPSCANFSLVLSYFCDLGKNNCSLHVVSD